MKKLLRSLAAALLCGAFVLPFAACGGTPDGPDGPDGPTEKPILLFQIDESVKNRELLGVYSNDYDGLHTALDNIFEATEPLTEQYDVRYLLGIHYQYQEEGFGNGDPSVPLNRISPVLKECLQYMEDHDKSMYLEQYSSNIFSHQLSKLDGSAGNDTLPPVPLHYGDTEKVYGMTMDVEALGAIAEEYDSFAGVRFHELIGSDSAYQVHISTDAIKAIVDVMAENGRQLVWGDHSWDTIYSLTSLADWKERLSYATGELGEDLIVNFSNNSWDLVKSVNLEPMLEEEDFKGASFGYSVQAWFWQESDVASLNTQVKPKWYTTAYQDMPVELMASFTLGGIGRGARLIQYEPPNYFFNYYYTGDTYNAANFTENGADYTGRITLARFIDLVTAPEAERIAASPDEFYSDREAQLDLNREEDSPKKYNQTTIGVIGAENDYFDVYNNDKTKVYASRENRFLPSVTEGEIIGVSRTSLTFGCRDELLVVRAGENGAVADFYYYNSSKMYSDAAVFADNEKGTVTAVTTANVLSEKVASLQGDPDEIIVRREKDGAAVYEVYKAVNVSDPAAWYPFSYRYSHDLEISASEVGAVEGYRLRNALKADETRVQDFVGSFTADGNSLSVKLDLARGAQQYAIDTVIETEGTIVDFVTADVDLDIEDDIVLLVRGADGKYRIEVYGRNGTEFEKLEGYGQTLQGTEYSSLFSVRTTTYYNKALAY